MKAEVIQKDGSTRLMEGIEKTFYYVIPFTANAQNKVRAFIGADGSYGSNGSLTNWESSESKLPAGYAFNLQKIGFILRNSDGSVLSPADISKVVIGNFILKISEKEKRGGLLAEFFDNAVKITDDTIDGHQEMPVKSFIPLLTEGGEWIFSESFDFSLGNLPAINTILQIIVCMKGIYYKNIE